MPDVARVVGLLKCATGAIDDPYFRLPIDGQDLPVYRERVYAYELYHQLRTIWPTEWQYTLNAEVDKRGHPLIRGTLQNVKPDLLVHTPGYMSGNLVALEIKPIVASVPDLKQDLEKLARFCTDAGYRRGVLLIFGAGEPSHLQAKLQSALEGLDKSLGHHLEVFWRSAPLTRCERLAI